MYKVIHAYLGSAEVEINALAKEGWRVDQVSSFYDKYDVRLVIVLIKSGPELV